MAIAKYESVANRDIDSIADYLAERNFTVALRFYAAVQKAAHQLAEMPGLGPEYGFKDPEYGDVRFWPITGFRNYLIFYRKIDGGITVLRVMHGARNIEKRFRTD